MEIWQKLRQALDDPAAGPRLFAESAQVNFQHFRNGEPLVGHLFPYLTVEEAHHQGLRFHESHGLFETTTEEKSSPTRDPGNSV